MKNKQLLIGLCLCTSAAFAQSDNWKTNGNASVSGDFSGTNNNMPLIF
ncbi:MAG: hypothetical protein ABI388_11125 [Bacteroidia bacterium]